MGVERSVYAEIFNLIEDGVEFEEYVGKVVT